MSWTLMKAKLPKIGTIRRFYTLTTNNAGIANHYHGSLPVLQKPRFRCAAAYPPAPTWRSFATLQASSESSMDHHHYYSMVALLHEQVQQGNLRYDKAQERVAKRLARLQQALQGYDNEILFQPISVHPKVTRNEDITVIPANNSESHPSLLRDENAAPATVSQNNPNGKSAENDASQSTTPRLRIPRGLYIHGSVGTGKSMLMDTFFAHAPVEKKARYHFHSFLAMVHEQIHRLKQQDLQEKGRNFSIDTSLENNPIHRVGLHLSRSIALLCLDEFQVTDIADAVILSQLFHVLFVQGTVVVATSNRPPQDLYEGGLNRSYFLPFIDLLQKHCIVHSIQFEVDYRHVLAHGGTSPSISSPSLSSSSPAPPLSFFGNHDRMMPVLQKVLQTIVMVDDDNNADHVDADVAHPKAVQLAVGFQRRLLLERTYESTPIEHNSNKTTPEDDDEVEEEDDDYEEEDDDFYYDDEEEDDDDDFDEDDDNEEEEDEDEEEEDEDEEEDSSLQSEPAVLSSLSSEQGNTNPLRLCRLDFVEMCDADLGALDYRAIAQRYPIVTLENVMVMDLEGHNRARRFITLIDELYEAKCCLLLSTATTTKTATLKDVVTPMDLFQVSDRESVSPKKSLVHGEKEEDFLVLDKNNDDKGKDPETVLGIDVATQGGTAVGALASVRELAFAFQRASSRIVEMCSQSWWEKQLDKYQQQPQQQQAYPKTSV